MKEYEIVKRTPERVLLDAFLSGRNRSTWEAYRNDLGDFATFTGSESIYTCVGKFLQMSQGEANGLVLFYRTSLTEKGLQPATVNRRLAAIRSLVKLGRTLGLVSWSIEITNLRSESYRDCRGPGRDAIQEMLAQVSTRHTPKQCRDYAILRLLFDLALRASEVTRLNVNDVDLERGTLMILGKGKTQKVEMSLPDVTKAALLNWMERRSKNTEALFYNFDRANKGRRFTRTGLYQLVRRLGEAVDVCTRPHGIRHTAITQAIKVAQVNGLTLPEVRQFSRHASLQTLQIYADKESDVQGRISSLVAQSVNVK